MGNGEGSRGSKVSLPYAFGRKVGNHERGFPLSERERPGKRGRKEGTLSVGLHTREPEPSVPLETKRTSPVRCRTGGRTKGFTDETVPLSSPERTRAFSQTTLPHRPKLSDPSLEGRFMAGSERRGLEELRVG